MFLCLPNPHGSKNSCSQLCGNDDNLQASEHIATIYVELRNAGAEAKVCNKCA